jgi:hypothetical protein
VDEDAVLVVRSRERNRRVVSDALPVEGQDRVARLEDVALGLVDDGQRVVVPVLAVVGAGHESRRRVLVVVHARNDVALVDRTYGNARLVLRQTGVVLVDPDVVAAVCNLLDPVGIATVERLRLLVERFTCLRTLGETASDAGVEVTRSGRRNVLLGEQIAFLARRRPHSHNEESRDHSGHG